MAEEKKGFAAEFKEFIMRGNVIDLAVGVIIGGAFQAIVSSLVDDIIMPIISLATKGIDFTKLAIQINEETTLNYGNFITAIINFLIMAFVIFMLVKGINKVHAIGKKEEPAAEEEAPTTKVCPFCKSEIAIDASRCPHCTSEIKE
ncbi:MAG: large conductance mechanosensitive channel protein MscL [Clostridia bacterium]|nr:large conductance mechanosensitive channel protein MscL [Clostridia bacterium]